MKLYEDSKNDYRSKNRCGYCREAGHNRTECPHVAKDWDSWKYFKVPERKQNWYRSRSEPKYWGEWYEDCRKTMIMQRDKALKASTPVVRSAPKCGFCGGKDHTRRNCPQMDAFIELCKKANHNYRKHFYNVFVKTYGIDVGAAVQIEHRAGWTTDTNETYFGLITKINLDKVNVFTAYDYGWTLNENYGQDLEVWALVDGEERRINMTTFCKKNEQLNAVVKRSSCHWSKLYLEKVIGHSKTPLPDDWVESYDDAWEFLAKKRTYKRLKEDRIVDHIQKWAILE